jgi:NlpC/P60 family putative phage cell wall peptidase
MPTRESIVAAARGWLGTPYRHQGRLKGVGCDCLGLLIGVFQELNGAAEIGAIPPYTRDWAEANGGETLRAGARRHLVEIAPCEAREGDILLFRWRAGLPAKHAAILVAPGRMVHAQEGACVAEVAVSKWWRRRVAYAFEFAFADP